MWAWLICGYAAFVALLCGCAGLTAVFGVDSARRADAFKVLKFVWGTGTGAGGLVAVAMRLHEMGAL